MSKVDNKTVTFHFFCFPYKKSHAILRYTLIVEKDL